jgi:hypothetical protein
MKRLLTAGSFLVLAMQPGFAAEKSADFADGFCKGFNAAVALEHQRAENWKATTLAAIGEGDPSKMTNVARTATVITNSVPMYVLLQPLQSKVDIGGGVTVDCAVSKDQSKAPTDPVQK